MKFVVFVAAALLAAVQARPAAAQHMELIKEAIAAMGGEQALRDLKTLTIRGECSHWEPDQSVIAGGAPRFLGDSSYSITWELTSDVVRTDWQRVMQYLASQKIAFSEVLTPKFGFVVDDKGSRAMSGVRLAAQLRELHRISPLLLLRMVSNPGSVTAEGGIRTKEGLLPGVSFRDGATTFLVMFDKKTHLPTVVRTVDDDAARGSVAFDLKFDDWKPVGGVMMAHRYTYQLGDIVVARMFYREVIANTAIDRAKFAASDAVKAAAKEPASGAVPYQWVLRQLYLGAFLDSDQLFVPPGGSLKLTELAPNVQHVVGGTHNTLIVAMRDGLVMFDAPISEGQSRWTIDAAKAKYGKPVKYLILTHHHRDHAAGVRTYMAEGAKIIVPAPDQKYFAKLALTQHIVPDEFQKRRISADVSEVKDDLSIKDDGGEVRIYRVNNPHVDGMLIAHIMPQNVVWVTDLWSPGVEMTKTAGDLALLEALKRIGIKSALIAGGHGSTAPQADRKIVGAQ